MFHKEFFGWIEKEWMCDGGLVDALMNFQKKLIAWNNDMFGHILKRKKWVRSRLEGVQRAVDVKWSKGLIKLEGEAKEGVDWCGAARRTPLVQEIASGLD